MNIETIKHKAKVLSTYMKEIGHVVKHGQALDAIARLNEHRSWNEYCAALERGLTAFSAEQEAKRKAEAHEKAMLPTTTTLRKQLPMSLANIEGSTAELKVNATLRTDDARARTQFDAAPWLHVASDAEMEELVYNDFSGCYAADAAAMHLQDVDDDVDQVFHYLSLVQGYNDNDTIGFEVYIEENDFWQFARAFRFPLYVRLSVINHFGSLAKAMEAGFGVKEDCDQKGHFYYTAGGEHSDVSYPSQDEAWTQLGKALEATGLANEEGIELSGRKAHPNSGIVRTEPQQSTGCETTVSNETDEVVRVAGRLDEVSGEPLCLTGEALALSELLRVTQEGTYGVQFVLAVDLFETMEGGLEWLNDHVSERITGSSVGLVDISYESYQGPWPEKLADGTSVLLTVKAWLDLDGGLDFEG